MGMVGGEGSRLARDCKTQNSEGKGWDEINAGLLKRGKETDLLGTAPKGRTQVRFLSTLNDIDTLQNVC